jgi:excisionase family DNA binding protein
MSESKYLTVDELAAHLQIHKTTLYRMLRQRQVPGFRVGRDWRFDRETIKQWQLDRMKNAASRSVR